MREGTKEGNERTISYENDDLYSLHKEDRGRRHFPDPLCVKKQEGGIESLLSVFGQC